jgi:hypothetical protein
MKFSLEGLVVAVVVGLACVVSLALLFQKIWPVALIVFIGYLWYKRDKDKRLHHKCLDCELKELHNESNS